MPSINFNFRDLPQILGALLTLIMLIVGIITGTNGINSDSSFTPDSNNSAPESNNSTTTHRVTQAELIDALNRYRSQHGLSQLKTLPALNNLAQDWANQMRDTQRLSHRPAFANYYPSGWRSAAENALQNYQDADANALIQQWHNSPGHRRNMQNPNSTHVGVGIAYDSQGKVWAVQNFAEY
ncbi:CAP domain-containing protein [Corynebacterium sp.]|uniref:CAP domain-containing protein n=1 Tax=Corynebacterium sp. TaxID=1720 RepID=UPI0026DC69D1|nr:CAP domain-containing protein [Corynebacterium sp.]MDO5032244.1 CAP domain-containing protein [Corynebacterium sp.]